ncbi:hypothetical protein K432DRAFT_98505 [Lepidopterella palustris CBS 459.81]|uniref:Uncharacterized protein n=1 Tax=Lepidopterella palustris CBS 459.81 TaxID=1314670 RepID=A0A8E2JJH7_9PEZI|nr:hypothetical protein K432DRAFT_98505 [Lepidopterella palustris CBS 459.81]
MRFDERAPLVTSIDDSLNVRPRDVVTLGGDLRGVESTISETQRNWVFPRQVNSAGRERRRRIESFYIHDCCRDEDDNFIHDWAHVVENYPSRGMTRQSHKLVAIWGIVNVFVAIKSVEYTAGIWNGSEEPLVQRLLWSLPRLRKRLLGVAPSWAWASGNVRLIGQDSYMSIFSVALRS